MSEMIKKHVLGYFETYPTRKIGFIAGVIIGMAILIFGFFNTIFALFCGIIGLYVGSRFEENDDLVSNTLKMIEETVPERFRYWKFFS